MQRHFTATHSDNDKKYPKHSELRQEFIEKSVCSLCSQQLLFVKKHCENKDVLTTSYEIALLIAKKMKPFKESKDIVKSALAIAAKLVGNRDFENEFKEISLANNSMTKRTHNLAANIKEQIILYDTNCCFNSLALDVSTDICDDAQQAIFIRTIDNNFKLIEELIGLESLKGTTKGAGLFEKLKQCIMRN